MNALFDTLSNLFGALAPDLRERLQAVIDNPNTVTWDNAYSIVVRSEGRWLTLWQAVIAVDPSFPRTGPSEDAKGQRLESWAKIPDRETILKALLYASKIKGAN